MLRRCGKGVTGKLLCADWARRDVADWTYACICITGGTLWLGMLARTLSMHVCNHSSFVSFDKSGRRGEVRIYTITNIDGLSEISRIFRH